MYSGEERSIDYSPLFLTRIKNYFLRQRRVIMQKYIIFHYVKRSRMAQIAASCRSFNIINPG